MNNPILRFSKESGNTYPDWNIRTIESLCENILGGGTPSKSNTEYWEGTIPWVSSSDLSLDKIGGLNVSRFISQEAIEHSSAKIIKKGSVLIVSRVGVGKVAVAPFNLCTSQDFTNLVSVKCNRYFLAYALTRLMKFKSKAVQGTAIKGIPASELKHVPLAVPCEEEQQKIAVFFSTLDEKIELSERKLEALEQLKKGLMQKLFRQEIRFKKKDGSNFPNWEKIQIKAIGKINTGATPSSSNENIELYGGSYLWVTPTDIKHKEIKSTSKKLTDAGLKLGRVIPENSVLVTCIASIGKNAILREKGSCNQQINSITPFPNFNLDFVYYAISFNEPVLHRYAGQGGMEILNKKDFSELELLMPSIEEQTIIADLLSEVDNKISLSVKQIEMLNILKKGFMQQMFV